VPAHASQMLANNFSRFVKLITRDGRFHLNLQDEVVRDTLTTHRGEVIHPQVREMLGLEPLKPPVGPGKPPLDLLASNG
jgi:H+-translocating NAD(P) transhydrogenase subunit alpha